MPNSNDSPTPAPLTTEVCGFCKQAIPPQTVDLGSRAYFFPGYCKCEGAIADREKRLTEESRQQRLEAINDLVVGAGIHVEKLGKYRFSTWNDSQYPGAGGYKQQVMQYANQVKIGGRNLLFIYGPYGVGKSHLAVAALCQCIVTNYMGDSRWTGQFCDWVEHCSLVQSSWNSDSGPTEGTLWGKMRGASILVIDDIDKRKPTEWALGKLFEVIQHRYYREKPTIITANHSIQELQAAWAANDAEYVRDAGGAILSRIMEQLFQQIGIKAKDQRDSL